MKRLSTWFVGLFALFALGVILTLAAGPKEAVNWLDNNLGFHALQQVDPAVTAKNAATLKAMQARAMPADQQALQALQTPQDAANKMTAAAKEKAGYKRAAPVIVTASSASGGGASSVLK